jgi:hypothetical protein
MNDVHMRWFSGAVIVFVAVVAITGFFLVGSPQKERAKKIDSIRTSHLSIMQYDIAEYWRQKKALPENLTLIRPIDGAAGLPKDPETQATYEYRVINDNTFELCANFLTASEEDESMYAYPMYGNSGPFLSNAEGWSHGMGRTCFTRQINESYYANLTGQDPAQVKANLIQ